jgi:hypothetical protein
MKNLFIPIICLFLIPFKSLAWGKTGHHIVAEIAKAHLEPGVLDSVQKYLGDMSFEDAATWMDDVRKDTSYNYMKPWHYVNVEKDKTYVYNQEDPKASDNVIERIKIAIGELNTRNTSHRNKTNFNLKLLFHLIGDLHQPLHAGYGVDKGGNDIRVKFLDKNANLHWVWDSEIIDAKKITFETVEAKYKKLSKKQLKKIQEIDVVKWMQESRAYLPKVYKFKDGKLDQKYTDKNAPIIEDQLLKGGLRLAAVLNAAFRKPTTQ